MGAGEVAVVGDSLHDLEMGGAAGAGPVVGVLSGTGEWDEPSARADHVLDSIVDLEVLLDRLSPSRAVAQARRVARRGRVG